MLVHGVINRNHWVATAHVNLDPSGAEPGTMDPLDERCAIDAGAQGAARPFPVEWGAPVGCEGASCINSDSGPEDVIVGDVFGGPDAGAKIHFEGTRQRSLAPQRIPSAHKSPLGTRNTLNGYTDRDVGRRRQSIVPRPEFFFVVPIRLSGTRENPIHKRVPKFAIVHVCPEFCMQSRERQSKNHRGTAVGRVETRSRPSRQEVTQMVSCKGGGKRALGQAESEAAEGLAADARTSRRTRRMGMLGAGDGVRRAVGSGDVSRPARGSSTRSRRTMFLPACRQRSGTAAFLVWRSP